MARYDLSETEWRLVEPLLPIKPRGVVPADDGKNRFEINHLGKWLGD